MSLGLPEILIIGLIIILLFGWKRLPDAARSIGRSMRIFKSEVKEMHNDDNAPADNGANTGVVPQPRELTQNAQYPQHPQQGYGVPNPQAHLTDPRGYQAPTAQPGYQQPHGYQPPQGPTQQH